MYKPYQEQRTDLIKKILKSMPDDFILKGGTALSLYYNSGRYSEDIDLDGISGKNIEKLKNMNFPEYPIWNVTVAKNTDTVYRLKIDYGGKNEDLPAGRNDYPLKLEVSFRNQNIKPSFYTKFGSVKVYKIEMLAEQKIEAFLQRSKARDIYDINFLLEKYPEKIIDRDYRALARHLDYRTLDEMETELKIGLIKNNLVTGKKISPEDIVLKLSENITKGLERKSKGLER